MIFSDECSFEVQMARQAYVRKGAEPLSSAHMAQTVKHPPKVMIWGCMSWKGFGSIHVVDGMMNSTQYINVMKTRLIPQAAEWFGNAPFIFQQDSAPCHTSKVSKSFMANNGIQLLQWPGNSPDMNPIETLWAILKQRLQQETYTSKQQLINKLLDLCVRDTELRQHTYATCKKLVEGVPARVQRLLKAKGKHTRH